MYEKKSVTQYIKLIYITIYIIKLIFIANLTKYNILQEIKCHFYQNSWGGLILNWHLQGKI